jgi:hypothetical protein
VPAPVADGTPAVPDVPAVPVAPVVPAPDAVAVPLPAAVAVPALDGGCVAADVGGKVPAGDGVVAAPPAVADAGAPEAAVPACVPVGRTIALLNVNGCEAPPPPPTQPVMVIVCGCPAFDVCAGVDVAVDCANAAVAHAIATPQNRWVLMIVLLGGRICARRSPD